jgi:hypothetical protein
MRFLHPRHSPPDHALDAEHMTGIHAVAANVARRSSMRNRFTALTLPLALGLGACADNALSPSPELSTAAVQAAAKGSGLTLNSVTGLTVPLIGIPLGDVVIDQAVITNFATVENTVGQIIGLEADGVLKLTGGVLGTDAVTEDFNTMVSVTSSGPGQCDLVTLDLAPIDVDLSAFGLGLASVDVPEANVKGKGSGAVGSLLCNLGQALSGLTSAIPGLVNALNNQI